jgi:hypothetical protein
MAVKGAIVVDKERCKDAECVQQHAQSSNHFIKKRKW